VTLCTDLYAQFAVVTADLEQWQVFRLRCSYVKLMINYWCYWSCIGCLMLIAWMVFASFGVLMPRYCKLAWPYKTWWKKKIWFQVCIFFIAPDLSVFVISLQFYRRDVHFILLCNLTNDRLNYDRWRYVIYCTVLCCLFYVMLMLSYIMLGCRLLCYKESWPKWVSEIGKAQFNS